MVAAIQVRSREPVQYVQRRLIALRSGSSPRLSLQSQLGRRGPKRQEKANPLTKP